MDWKGPDIDVVTPVGKYTAMVHARQRGALYKLPDDGDRHEYP